MADTIKTSFSVNEATFQQIKDAAQKSGKSISIIVRILFQKILRANIAQKPSPRATVEYGQGPCSRKIYVRLPVTMVSALGTFRAWHRISISALLAVATKFVGELESHAEEFCGEPLFTNILALGQNIWHWVTRIEYIEWLSLPDG